MDRYPPEVQAIVTFERDAQQAVEVAERTAQRLGSVRITGQRLAVHLERIGVASIAQAPR